MVGREVVYIEDKITTLFEHKIRCPICGSEADIIASEYRSSYEAIAIITLRCMYCGYKKNDFIPIIEEDENKCLEITVSDPQDLNILLFIPPSSVIEIPEINLKIEIAELEDMRIGSYVTADAILHEIAYFLESSCRDQEASQDTLLGEGMCISLLETVKQIIENNLIPTPLTIRITNSYGNIKIVKTYRSNYRKC